MTCTFDHYTVSARDHFSFPGMTVIVYVFAAESGSRVNR